MQANDARRNAAGGMLLTVAAPSPRMSGSLAMHTLATINNAPTNCIDVIGRFSRN